MKSRFLLIPTIILLVLISACDRNIDTRPVPKDQDPVIALAETGRAQLLRRIGSTADINLRIGDNENLKLLRITESIFDQDSMPLLSDQIKQDIPLNQNGLFVYTYNYSITSNVAGINLGDYYRIRLAFYAIDSKGVSSSVTVDIDILPDPLGPPAFDLRSYSDIRLSHPNDLADQRSTFYFIGRSYPTNNDLNKDIMIVDSRPGPFTSKFFTSPASIAKGTDTMIFVKTGPEKINFDEADHRIIKQGYLSAEKYYGTLPTDFEVGDMVIVRLSQEFTNPNKHYALMRIKEFVSDGAPADQYILFDYKVSD
ncbi:MAG: hypothetical protein AB8F95_21735 [Bacteroidia bacterium]